MTVRYKDRDYIDPRIPHVDMEITKYVVAVVPCDPVAKAFLPGEAGSGTCVTIGGRFFIATAAHVILDHPRTPYAIVGLSANDAVPSLKAGGVRGGRHGEDIDLGWLELTSDHARILDREFLPLQRLRTHCAGRNEALAVCGAPIVYQRRDSSFRGKGLVTVETQWFSVDVLSEREDLGEEPDLARRLYLHWPRLVAENDGSMVEQPNAPGLSGGGVWALNLNQPNWEATHAQLVGIEYSWAHRGVPDRFLRAYQIQLWLQMLADDIPELRREIEPFIGAGRLFR